MTEAELQIQVADYLRLQYPDVIFHSDYGSGIKLTTGQAMKQKRQNGGLKGYPDMFIAEPIKDEKDNIIWAGLFIELKREGTRLQRTDGGGWATEHIAEQAKMMQKLLKKGYFTRFACGFEQAKEVIDYYLKGE